MFKKMRSVAALRPEQTGGEERQGIISLGLPTAHTPTTANSVEEKLDCLLKEGGGRSQIRKI